jgi:sulfite exporter TauE/SafE
MALFGALTAPALVLLAMGGRQASPELRARLAGLRAALLVTVAVLTLWRGVATGPPCCSGR